MWEMKMKTYEILVTNPHLKTNQQTKIKTTQNKGKKLSIGVTIKIEKKAKDQMQRWLI